MPTGWMSDVEALMWHVERDPYLDPTFGSLTLLDAVPDVGHLRARLARLVRHNPRFAQRVVQPAGRLTPPAWCDDPDFDLDRHLRRLRLPEPGTRRQLFDMATRVVQDPLDRDRPLWEFVLIEGLAEGGAALVQKLHHTITDGEGGLRLAAEILDLGPELPELPDLEPLPGGASAPSALGLLTDAAGYTARRVVATTRSIVGGTVGLATHPGRVPDAVTSTIATTRSVLDQFTFDDRPLSPLWTARTLRRRFDGLDVPLDRLRAVARALDGSVNDAFVTGLTGAIAELHRQEGRPVASLRMAMPVSTRRRGTSGGNAFVPTRLVVAVDEPDPRRRFATTRAALERAKREPVLEVADRLAVVAGVVPVPVLAKVAREQARAVDFTASNLRGASVPLWLGGARVQADYPLGPLAATALNVSMLSYDGTCHLGVHSDPGAVTDPDLLVTLLEASFAELFDLAG